MSGARPGMGDGSYQRSLKPSGGKSSIEKFGSHVSSSVSNMWDKIKSLVGLRKEYESKKKKSVVATTKKSGYTPQRKMTQAQYTKLIRDLKSSGRAKNIFDR